jgi:hypothetical protein
VVYANSEDGNHMPSAGAHVLQNIFQQLAVGAAYTQVHSATMETFIHRTTGICSW